MTALDPAIPAIPAIPAAPPGKPGWFSRMLAAIAAGRQRRAYHRILIELSHHDAHLLRDIGIDPADVADALTRRSMSLLFSPIRAPYERGDDSPR